MFLFLRTPWYDWFFESRSRENKNERLTQVIIYVPFFLNREKFKKARFMLNLFSTFKNGKRFRFFHFLRQSLNISGLIFEKWNKIDLKKKKEKKNKNFIQGDPNQNLLFQLALCLNVGIPDPKLVKPKCVWEAEVLCVKS